MAAAGTAAEAATVAALANRYLAYLHHAWNPELGRFRNFLSYQRQWLEQQGSEDSHGRSVWALGFVLGIGADSDQQQVAMRLFEPALETLRRFTSPRAWAFAMLSSALLLVQAVVEVAVALHVRRAPVHQHHAALPRPSSSAMRVSSALPLIMVCGQSTGEARTLPSIL